MVTKHDMDFCSDEEFDIVTPNDSGDKKTGYLGESIKTVKSIYKQWSSNDALIAVMG